MRAQGALRSRTPRSHTYRAVAVGIRRVERGVRRGEIVRLRASSRETRLKYFISHSSVGAQGLGFFVHS